MINNYKKQYDENKLGNVNFGSMKKQYLVETERETRRREREKEREREREREKEEREI